MITREDLKLVNATLRHLEDVERAIAVLDADQTMTLLIERASDDGHDVELARDLAKALLTADRVVLRDKLRALGVEP